MKTLLSLRSFRSVAIVLGLAAFPAAQAATLLTFSTTQNPAAGYDASLVSVSLAPGLSGPSTPADITASASTLFRFYNNGWAGFSVFGTNPGNGTGASTADNFTTRGAFVFTLTADAGSGLALTSFDFLGARGGTLGTRGFEVFASINGVADFSTDFVFSEPDIPLGYTRASPNPYSLDLSGSRYQGITSVTFRYIPLTTSGQTTEFSGFTVNGNVAAVPEPGTLVLLGLAGFGSVFFLRRARTSIRA